MLVKRFFEEKSADARQKAQQDWTSCEHFSFASPLRYLTQQMRILTKNTVATRSTTLPKFCQGILSSINLRLAGIS